MITINTFEILTAIAVCFPSAVVSFCFWLLKRNMDKRQKEEQARQNRLQEKIDAQDAKRRQSEFLALKNNIATTCLAEATAEAVARIPDAHCNGDMHAALEFARRSKREVREFLEQEGISAIYEKGDL